MDANFKKNKHLIEICAQRGAKLVCIPENFHYMPRTYEESIKAAEPLNGPILKKYKQLALDNRVWLSLGGFAERCDHNPAKRYSKYSMNNITLDTHLIINEEGNIVQEYRKLHLYDIDLTHKVGLTFLTFSRVDLLLRRASTSNLYPRLLVT
jgi:deaminated glutathione amidase